MVNEVLFEVFLQINCKLIYTMLKLPRLHFEFSFRFESFEHGIVHMVH